MRRCAEGDLSICSLNETAPCQSSERLQCRKMAMNTADTSHGTHQLGLRLNVRKRLAWSDENIDEALRLRQARASRFGSDG